MEAWPGGATPRRALLGTHTGLRPLTLCCHGPHRVLNDLLGPMKRCSWLTSDFLSPPQRTPPSTPCAPPGATVLDPEASWPPMPAPECTDPRAPSTRQLNGTTRLGPHPTCRSWLPRPIQLLRPPLSPKLFLSFYLLQLSAGPFQLALVQSPFSARAPPWVSSPSYRQRLSSLKRQSLHELPTQAAPDPGPLQRPPSPALFLGAAYSSTVASPRRCVNCFTPQNAPPKATALVSFIATVLPDAGPWNISQSRGLGRAAALHWWLLAQAIA